MYNNVTLMGRLTKDAELRYQQGTDKASARFTLAVERKYKGQDGEKVTDFINCVAFNKTAEFISKYFAKGNLILVRGEIWTGSYTNKDGVKIYTTDVMVEEARFTGEKKNDAPATNNRPAPSATSADGFMDIPDDLGDELPFA